MKVKTTTYYNNCEFDHEIIQYMNNGKEKTWLNKADLPFLLEEAWKAGRNGEEFILEHKIKGDLPEGKDTGLCFDYKKNNDVTTSVVDTSKYKLNQLDILAKYWQPLDNNYTININIENYSDYEEIAQEMFRQINDALRKMGK